MLKKYITKLPKSFSLFDTAPSIDDRTFWDNIPDVMRKKAVERAKRAKIKPTQELTIDLWLSFSRTGAREPYQKAYFPKRRKLSDLVIAECVENKGEYLSEILNLIYSICGEFAWWIPAHNTYVRDEKQLVYPDTTNPILELFSAETGALLAVCCQMLKGKLDVCVIKHVEKALHERIITPFLNGKFWWMGYSDTQMCNWTPWCVQNVLLTSAFMNIDEYEKQRVVVQALQSLDCFIDEYAEDGCCNEGAQYYSHAALALFGCVETLRGIAPNVFDEVYQNTTIKNMAAFIHNMHVDDKYYINFADCSAIAGRRTAKEFAFAKHVQNKEMMKFCAVDFEKSLADEELDSDIERTNVWNVALDFMYAKEILAVAKESGECKAEEKFYPSVGIFVSRDEKYFLAAKAGNNDDSHNHNDVGSVTLYKNGKPFLIDLGVETYTQKTFSEKRYEIWTMQSAWHNLPTFGGVMQEAGAEYKARDIKTSFGKEENVFEADISTAYPDNVDMEKYVRAVTHKKGSNVCIEDKTDYDGIVELTLMSQEKPIVEKNAVVFGNLGVVEVYGSLEIKTEEISITDARLRKAWPEMLYRTVVSFEKEIKLEIK